jgi:hypothetical protein
MGQWFAARWIGPWRREGGPARGEKEEEERASRTICLAGFGGLGQKQGLNRKKDFSNFCYWIWMNSKRFQRILKSKLKFELWFKDSNQRILNSKPRIIWVQTEDLRIEEIWIQLWMWIEMKVLIFIKKNLIRKIFEVHSEMENWLGSGMKFESRNFDCNKFPISERFKPFCKKGIWSLAGGFKIQTDRFKPRMFSISKARISISKEDLVQRFWTPFTLLNSKEYFEWKLDRILVGVGSIGQGIFPKYSWVFL